MTHFKIPMNGTDRNNQGYGIRAQSEFVYDTTMSHYPTRVVLWDNTSRPNPDKGKQLGDKLRSGNVVTEYSKRYTAGAWLDPKNEPTDDMLTILLSTESISICANRDMTTGQPGSGQVFTRQDEKMRDGDTATLVYGRNGFGNVEVTLHFPRHSNGYGYATFGIDKTDPAG